MIEFGLITYKFTRLVCTVHYFIRIISLKLMALGKHVFDYGFGELFLLGLKRPRCETEYSPPSNTEFKNRRNYTSPPPYIFKECKGTKLRES